MRKLTAFLLIMASACSGETGDDPARPSPNEAPAEPSRMPSGTMPDATPPNALPPSSTDESKSPVAALRVARAYFTALSDRRYGDAWALWSDGGRSSGMSRRAFARSFAKYRSYKAMLGAPGRVEGAAGSLYIEVPVTVTGMLTSGRPYRLEGPVTLRRANDVPGATAEQLQWRISISDLKPRPEQASYRFIGRWAADVRSCDAAAWTFASDRLRSADGKNCRFTDVREAAGGYDIAARCAPGGNDTIEIRFAESARAMLITSPVVGDAGLVRCD